MFVKRWIPGNAITPSRKVLIQTECLDPISQVFVSLGSVKFYFSICAGNCKKETHEARSELDIPHLRLKRVFPETFPGAARTNHILALSISLNLLNLSKISNFSFLKYNDILIVAAGGNHIPKFGVGPGHTPNCSFMQFFDCKCANPLVFVTLLTFKGIQALLNNFLLINHSRGLVVGRQHLLGQILGSFPNLDILVRRTSCNFPSIIVKLNVVDKVVVTKRKAWQTTLRLDLIVLLHFTFYSPKYYYKSLKNADK